MNVVWINPRVRECRTKQTSAKQLGDVELISYSIETIFECMRPHFANCPFHRLELGRYRCWKWDRDFQWHWKQFRFSAKTKPAYRTGSMRTMLVTNNMISVLVLEVLSNQQDWRYALVLPSRNYNLLPANPILWLPLCLSASCLGGTRLRVNRIEPVEPDSKNIDQRKSQLNKSLIVLIQSNPLTKTCETRNKTELFPRQQQPRDHKRPSQSGNYTIP